MAARIRNDKKSSEPLYAGFIQPKGSKIFSKSLTVFEITDIFNFRQNSRWWPEIEKLKFIGAIICINSQRFQNLLDNALSLIDN